VLDPLDGTKNLYPASHCSLSWPRSYGAGGVARSWIYTLLARYQAEADAAFEPRSRRPKTSPRAISADTADLIVRLRKELTDQSLDAGPVTIAWHLTPAGREDRPEPTGATAGRSMARSSCTFPRPWSGPGPHGQRG